MPEVSVVIPAYNMATYTVEAVESVLAQTYRDYELLVIDDGSKDGTGEALKIFKDKIKYIYKENGGVCSARNLGIKLAAGKYIAFLDCDDNWLPRKLEESLKGFSGSDIGLVYTDGFIIDKDGKITENVRKPSLSEHPVDDLLIMNIVFNPSVVVKKSCFDIVGHFDEKMFYAADWDMWLRISEKYGIIHIKQPLSRYRVVRSYLHAHTNESKKDLFRMLSKARSRNPALSAALIRQAHKRIYLQAFMSYARNKRLIPAIRELKMLFMTDPLIALRVIITHLYQRRFKTLPSQWPSGVGH